MTIIFTNFLSITQVEGESMMPNVKNKEYLLLDIFTYKITDSIIEKSVIYINGKKLMDDKYFLEENLYEGINYCVTLGEDEYFVMGDNRNNSYDSRDIGPVKKETIQGIVLNNK